MVKTDTAFFGSRIQWPGPSPADSTTLGEKKAIKQKETDCSRSSRITTSGSLPQRSRLTLTLVPEQALLGDRVMTFGKSVVKIDFGSERMH